MKCYLVLVLSLLQLTSTFGLFIPTRQPVVVDHAEHKGLGEVGNLENLTNEIDHSLYEQTLKDVLNYLKDQVEKEIQSYFNTEGVHEESEFSREEFNGKDNKVEISGEHVYGTSVGNDKVTNLYIFNYKKSAENQSEESYEENDETQEEEDETKEEDDDDDEDHEEDNKSENNQHVNKIDNWSDEILEFLK